MIPFQFLSLVKDIPATGYWDHTLLTDLFNNDSRFFEINEDTAQTDGSIIILPAPYHNQAIEELNLYLSKYKWVILVVTSDESSIFKVEEINHPNIQIYMMYPKIGRHDTFKKMPLGYSKDYRNYLKLDEKKLDFFFSGQVTNHRRAMFYSKVKGTDWENKYHLLGEAFSTDGFAKGMPKNEYATFMNAAKTVPSPPGPMTSDSFRVYESLESGAVPVVDGWGGSDVDFFRYIFNDAPFAFIKDYEDLPGYIEDQVRQYPRVNNRAQAWWLRYKQELKNEIVQDAEMMSGTNVEQWTTIIVPVSPIKSHPSTEKLEACINSIRHHIKESEAQIILTFDGVREEQEHLRQNYEEFIRRALFLANTQWGNVIPIIFETHTHQVGMMREALKHVKTPTVLYVEGDVGFVIDRYINFAKAYKKIESGDSNLVRFHHEAVIPFEHDHLMVARDGDFIETIQWSQRPHLASTAYYERLLESYFSENAKSFIEDKMHGVVQNDYHDYGKSGWYQHRIHIFAPEDNLKYTVDFDGRDGDVKYDGDQIF